MKKKVWLYPLAIMGVVLILISNCKKKTDDNNSPTTFHIGQSYGGGVIFYLDGTGKHGLIAATLDQGDAPWGCVFNNISTSTAIGTGQANTTAIVNGCSEAGIAARICDTLTLNGCTDWHLPSKDELNLMCLQRTVIGGFANGYYWSSSGLDDSNAWRQNFYNGGQGSNIKTNNYYVRAVRAF